ncbi:MAG: bifunctional phosphopantothenoylcysteine decarboxylase/phosphopantothenate--cysteine ligase CoaBC [Gemmatimonadaceae bacterium]|nr:bifunctional phosphopantothenoylcysteine decarboxylase/phosphopantothenate--cysteine ligase CoaBC [Gemmatimonadaceae bacterium]
MRPFAGRRILLGVTGGIAAYKVAFVARSLVQAGALVDVVLTRSAREFIGAVTFEALTGRPVHTEFVAEGSALDHIKLPRAAELIVVAPATADFLARVATGQASDLLTASLLAAEPGCPVLLVPAMNDRMWDAASVRANVAALRSRGYHVLEPDTGPLASTLEGSGAGRMPEPPAIVAHAARLLESPSLTGKRVLITAGPTREPLDPVRFLSNHSSGKMGVALAEAAWRRGAEVTLIAGPLAVPIPTGGVTVVSVETTEEMGAAVADALPTSDVLVMAAAPADFRATDVAPEKIKKGSAAPTLALTHTPDILASTIGARKPGAVIVGFALETTDVLAHGRAKLDRKELDLIVINDATEPGAGFGGDTNRVTLLARGGEPEPLALMPKAEVAEAILDRVEALQRGR